MSRVSIRDFGAGSIRMRIVRDGYNADNLNTPARQVVFDSDAAGAMPVHQVGTAVITGSGPVATWPSPGFLPLVTSYFGKDGIFYPCYPAGGAGAAFVTFSTETSIRVEAGSSFIFPLDFVYIVWAVPAQ